MDLFIKLMDKIIELMKQRKLDRTETFDQVIEPLFVQLAPLVEDYLAFFRKTRDLLNEIDNRRGAYDEIPLLVRPLRETMLTSRIRLREQARVVAETCHDDELSEFALDIADLFYSTQVYHHQSDGAYLVELLEVCAEKMYPYGDAKTYVSSAIHNLEDGWANLARQYAELRLKYLNPNARLPKSKTRVREERPSKIPNPYWGRRFGSRSE